MEVEKTPPTAIDMLEPPPPPPPPPPEPQEKPPEPTEKPTPVPEPTPAPTPDQPAPMKIDGPAQAGTDSFGMSAGSGGGTGAPGSGGTCTTPPCGGAPASTAPKAAPSAFDRFWGPGIARVLEDRLEASKKVNPNAYLAEFAIWVDANGSITKAQLIKGSNDRKLDQVVLAQLEQARGLKPPPASIQMPQRIKVGRKRLS